ncbi:MAG TPA: hypothetical protein VGL55_13435 [Steroidobacteraceae bacterium]|jgi:hypothetical protein
MYAVIRDNTLEPVKAPAETDSFEEFQAAHAGQPGYSGTVIVDLGEGRQLSLTLWRSEEEAEAARVALGPVIKRTLQPLMRKPSTLVGRGKVLFNDLSEDAAP